MTAVFLDAHRYLFGWTATHGPLGEAYWNAALGLMLAFTAWHAWVGRNALPARSDWRLDVAVSAIPAAYLLYSACRGYVQVLGL